MCALVYEKQLAVWPWTTSWLASPPEINIISPTLLLNLLNKPFSDVSIP